MALNYLHTNGIVSTNIELLAKQAVTSLIHSSMVPCNNSKLPTQTELYVLTKGLLTKQADP